MAETRINSLGRPVLYALVALGLYLSYRILGPFIVALTWAMMLAVLCHGMQAALARKTTAGRAAVVMTVVVGLGLVTPAVAVITILAREAPQVADHFKQASPGVPSTIQRIWDAARVRIPAPMPEDPTALITQSVHRVATFLASHAGALVADFLANLGTLGAMLFALYFMLRDGETMARQVRDRLPFSQFENERLMSDTRDLLVASVGASLIVSAAQGAIAGLAFWLLGLGAPVFWAVVTSFCSFLPVVGATLVWVPAAIALLLSGEIWRGVVMLLIGVFGITMIGNALRPLMLTGKTSVSGLVVFFGLVGGALAFGFVGLVIGPIILVTTARLLEDLHHPDLLPPSEPPRDPGVVA